VGLVMEEPTVPWGLGRRVEVQKGVVRREIVPVVETSQVIEVGVLEERMAVPDCISKQS
jgi:hypothetical protein